MSPRPARPATCVSNWNVRSAARKSGMCKREVGVDDPDQRDVGKMQALRDHLRADEDVGLARFERTQRIAMRVLALHGVGIHARDAGAREDLGDHVLDPLRAEAAMADGGIAALGIRAALGRLLPVAADVAHELVLASGET